MGLVSKDDGWRMPDWLWERIQPLSARAAAASARLPQTRECPTATRWTRSCWCSGLGMQWNALDQFGPAGSSSSHRALSGVGADRGLPGDLASGVAGLRRAGRDRLGLAGGRRGDDEGAAGRPQDRAPIPLTELKRGEALGPHGGRRRADRDCHEGANRHDQKLLAETIEVDPDRAPPSQPRRRPRDSAWTAPTTRRRCTSSPLSTASRRTYARAARRSPTSCARRAGGRVAGSSKAAPLLAQPQPRHPYPMVQEGREPPRPAAARQRPDRIQEGPRGPTGIGS